MATEKAVTKEAKLEWTPLPDINIKKIGGDPKQAVKLEKTVYVGRIFGELTDVKTKEARNGDSYQYLVGVFRAVGPDGKKFESEKLYLPGGIMEALEAAFKSGGEKPIEFGYDFFALYDADTVLNYRYSAKTLIKTAASDRLAAMAGEMEKLKVPKEA